MPAGLEISFFGDLRVARNGTEVPLPASRKARALLAFLVETGRPHRRERLCELFWDLPDDPKAALRWSLSKLRKVVDAPDRVRILADRERVAIDGEGLSIDILEVRAQLRGGGENLSVVELEGLARRLDAVLLDGLDEAGDGAFRSWLAAMREDASAARKKVLQLLAMRTGDTSKWMRLWRDAAPEDARAIDQTQHNPGFGEEQDALEAPAGQTSDPLAPSDRRLSRPGNAEALRAQRIGFCDAADGTKIAYASIGSGRPILKAANWLNHLEFDWTTPIWGECFAEVARDRTLIRYDERGCGLSDWEVETLSFDAFVEDLEAVADKLELERFPLLGISQGAAVAIEYAVRHPERVSGLILVGSYAAGWRHLASPEEQARREAVRNLTEVGWGTENPAYRHIFSKTFMPDAEVDDLAWFDEFQRQTTSPQNAARFQDAFGEIDVRHRLDQVKAPTIVLHSKGDQRIPLAQGRAVASGIPDARFVPLESRNHVLVDYEPAWRTGMDAIRDFMRTHGL
ncbi:alpha/beta hydrolase [uncultured Roseobacter sp.]|uniref:alpha/beta hydrolase n=1 Tax=uncultured Roseobacter sp. TaxID=114847 RepID=UPI00261F5AD2|nr:alpha/beta hydrolase [uncultured Roseobacter sp.]